MKIQLSGEIRDDQLELTVPQVIKRLQEVHLCFAADPCLIDLATETERLIHEVLERCRLAAEVAAEARRDRGYH